MNPFDIAFEEIIGIEGGYVNDPDDAGGETKYGISKRAFPEVDIKNLTLEQAKQIYYTHYWLPLLLHKVNNKDLAVEIFEQAVNMGLSRAAIHVQDSLNLMGRNVLVDGDFGPVTLSNVNSLMHHEIVPMLKCLNGFQFMKYLQIVQTNKSQTKFFVGWLKRVSLNLK